MLILKEHQRSGKEFLHNRLELGGLLWHEMGLGKTITSLEYARERLAQLKREGVANPKFLVIAPKSAGITWRKEVQKNAADLWNAMIMLPVSRLKHYKKFCLHHDIRVIIIDESHYIKNPEADRTKELGNIFKFLGTNAVGRFEKGKVIFLTGTPYLNAASELYSSWAVLTARSAMEAGVRLLSQPMFHNWREKFANREEIAFTKFDRRKKMTVSVNAVNWVGTNKENRSEMDNIIASFTHFRRAIDCLDMPDKNLIEVDLGIPDDTLLSNANIEMPDYYTEVLEKIARLKTPYAVDWLKSFFDENPDKQIVVFSQYKYPIQTLKEMLGERMAIVTGDEVGRSRDANIHKFQEGKVKIIGLSYGAGAESINLQNAHYALYIGYPWTWGKLAQAMARIWRQGQAHPTFHYFLLSGESDRRVLAKVMTKKEETETLEKAMMDYQKYNTIDDLI